MHILRFIANTNFIHLKEPQHTNSNLWTTKCRDPSNSKIVGEWSPICHVCSCMADFASCFITCGKLWHELTHSTYWWVWNAAHLAIGASVLIQTLSYKKIAINVAHSVVLPQLCVVKFPYSVINTICNVVKNRVSLTEDDRRPALVLQHLSDGKWYPELQGICQYASNAFRNQRILCETGTTYNTMGWHNSGPTWHTQLLGEGWRSSWRKLLSPYHQWKGADYPSSCTCETTRNQIH